jgi:hypothetical protein
VMATYVVETRVEVEIDSDDLDAFDEAKREVDELMQRAWDTDQGRHHVKKWHFTILDDAVVEVVE